MVRGQGGQRGYHPELCGNMAAIALSVTVAGPLSQMVGFWPGTFLAYALSPPSSPCCGCCSAKVVREQGLGEDSEGAGYRSDRLQQALGFSESGYQRGPMPEGHNLLRTTHRFHSGKPQSAGNEGPFPQRETSGGDADQSGLWIVALTPLSPLSADLTESGYLPKARRSSTAKPMKAPWPGLRIIRRESKIPTWWPSRL